MDTLTLSSSGLRRIFQKSHLRHLNFDGERQIFWGYETQLSGNTYDWDGLKRGTSPSQSQVLFQFTLEGRGEYTEGGKYWALQPGQSFTVLLPSDHRYFLPDNSKQWTFFWFILQHPFIYSRIGKLRENEAAVQTWEAGSAALAAATLLFEAGCQGRLRDIWTFEEMAFSWLLQTERESHQRRYPQDERQRLLETARRVILERLDQPPSVTNLADLSHMERTTYSRKFKAGTGISPAAFVTEVRLEEALKMLRTEAKLEEIAASTGFADANHFCKVFRNHFQYSPGSYRRLILKR